MNEPQDYSGNQLNPDMPIVVAVGAQFTVTLEANHTTGYSWQLASLTDPDLVRLVGSEYKTHPHEPGMVGVGGQEVWTFAALAPGQTTVTLNYQRPWETDTPPAETTSFALSIE